MAEGDQTNPYVGRKGFWNRWNRFTYRFSGASQVGVGRGRTEAPYVPPADPRCPVCGLPMRDHRIDRGSGNRPTRINCPV